MRGLKSAEAGDVTQLRTARANRRCGRAVVSALYAGGVRDVFLSPGSRSTPLVLALAEREDMHTHVVVDERCAAFAALGAARHTDSPVALVCTSGSAAGNYLPGIMEAHASATPLIVITADRPPELHGVGASQTTNQHRLFANHTSHFTALPVPGSADDSAAGEEAGTLVLDAVSRACRTPRGPVQINAPFRKPLWMPEADEPPTSQVERAVPAALEHTPDALHDTAAAAERVSTPRLASSQRGLLFLGPLSLRNSADAAAAAHFADALGWPVLLSAAAGFPLDHPAVCTDFDLTLQSGEFPGALTPDTVVRVGMAPIHSGTHRAFSGLRAEPHIVVSAFVDAALEIPATHVLRGSTAEVLRRLTPPATSNADSTAATAFAERWARRSEQSAVLPASSSLWEGEVAQRLMETTGPDTVLVVANSMPIRDIGAFGGPTRSARRVHCARGLAGIDGTLSAAVGTACVGSRARVRVVVGDLAFRHDIGGLVQAVESGAALDIFVIDNGGGGIFGFLPIAANAAAFEPYFRTPQHTDVMRLAQSLVDDCAELSSLAALNRRLEQAHTGALRVTVIRVDASANVAAHMAAYSEAAALNARAFSRASEGGGAR